MPALALDCLTAIVRVKSDIELCRWKYFENQPHGLANHRIVINHANRYRPVIAVLSLLTSTHGSCTSTWNACRASKTESICSPACRTIPAIRHRYGKSAFRIHGGTRGIPPIQPGTDGCELNFYMRVHACGGIGGEFQRYRGSRRTGGSRWSIPLKDSIGDFAGFPVELAQLLDVNPCVEPHAGGT